MMSERLGRRRAGGMTNSKGKGKECACGPGVQGTTGGYRIGPIYLGRSTMLSARDPVLHGLALM